MSPDALVAYEPFLAHLGLQIVSATPGHAVLRLALADHLTNHVHSIHAGAQYTLGESTAAMVGFSLILDHLADVTLLTQSATITYRRPARGGLRAEGGISDEVRANILSALASGQRATCEVPVTITDEDGKDVTFLQVTCVFLPQRPLASDGQQSAT
jgi:uncharacterized protein (TIGR00369 family)